MSKPGPDVVEALKRKVRELEQNARQTSRIIGDMIASNKATLDCLRSLKSISKDHQVAIDRLVAQHQEPEHHGERLH